MVVINKVYTRNGDGGRTSLVGGLLVEKDCLRICCCGTLDELNSIIGSVLFSASKEPLEINKAIDNALAPVQQRLFDLGAEFATPSSRQITTALDKQDVLWLEKAIDTLNAKLPPLKSFVLPSGGYLGVQLHLARTVCRRAERLCVSLQKEIALDTKANINSMALIYLNRLSDWLFVLARWCSQQKGETEVLWQPRQPFKPFSL